MYERFVNDLMITWLHDYRGCFHVCSDVKLALNLTGNRIQLSACDVAQDLSGRLLHLERVWKTESQAAAVRLHPASNPATRQPSNTATHPLNPLKMVFGTTSPNSDSEKWFDRDKTVIRSVFWYNTFVKNVITSDWVTQLNWFVQAKTLSVIQSIQMI